jgi:purine-nucleoside phosphorylase
MNESTELTGDLLAYRQRVEEATEWLRERLPEAPRFGVILGSGLGGLVCELTDNRQIPYEEIPGFPASTAPGHSGTLHAGRLGSTPVVAFEGRFHMYEGYTLREITMPVRVMARLGIPDVLITAACGGLNPVHQKGDLLILEDHINLLGANPLTGPNIDDWGPRFPDLHAPYHPDHVRRLEKIALEEQIRAHTGTYVAVPGPNLETRAEYRMLRAMGADVVGMSTVPEVLVCVHEGIRAAGISVITDICLPDALEQVSVEEILQVAGEAEPMLTRMATGLIAGDE